MGYEILENITSADLAVRVRGSSLSELFVNTANALVSEMINDVSSIKKETSRKGVLEGTDISILFFEFLNELIFFRDAENLLLVPDAVNVHDSGGLFTCEYTFSGETINRVKHEFKTEIKAVTLHRLNIYESGGQFVAETVFDV